MSGFASYIPRDAASGAVGAASSAQAAESGAASGSSKRKRQPATAAAKESDLTDLWQAQFGESLFSSNKDDDDDTFEPTEKKKKKKLREVQETEHHEYIREHCAVPSDTLLSFDDVVGARVARRFAEQYRPVSSGAARAVSGLLLFGPSGTGKSVGPSPSL